jgi:hypothetical protein
LFAPYILIDLLVLFIVAFLLVIVVGHIDGCLKQSDRDAAGCLEGFDIKENDHVS